MIHGNRMSVNRMIIDLVNLPVFRCKIGLSTTRSGSVHADFFCRLNPKRKLVAVDRQSHHAE
jgi:hypothetical protein